MASLYLICPWFVGFASTNRLIKVSVQHDLEEEGMDQYSMHYRNNKPIIDALLNNPDGLFYIFDDATKNCEENCEYITSNKHIPLRLSHKIITTYYLI